MTTHSSILAWRMPLIEEPGRLQSTGLQKAKHDLATKQQLELRVGTCEGGRDLWRFLVICICSFANKTLTLWLQKGTCWAKTRAVLASHSVYWQGRERLIGNSRLLRLIPPSLPTIISGYTVLLKGLVLELRLTSRKSWGLM